MKQTLQLLWLLMLPALIICCKKETDKAVENSTYRPSSRPAGEPVGASETFEVSLAPARITTGDGNVQIDIPPNGVSGRGNLQVQKIKNTSPGGLGYAYRIFTDRAFLKPVTVKLSYADFLDSLSFIPECTMGISVQDPETGIWKLMTNVTFNNIQQFIEFDTELSKFDIAVVRPFTLTPAYSIVRPNTEVKFKIHGNIPFSGGGLCELYESGIGPIEMGDEFEADSRLVKKWELLGAGDGIGKLEANGSRAVYTTSPYEVPPINPITILVFMEYSIRPLSAKVYVEPEISGLKFTAGDNQYHFHDDNITVGVANGIIGINWEFGRHMGFFNIKGTSPGSYPWGDGTEFLFEPGDMSPPQAFQSYFNDGTTISGGNVKITSVGAVGERIIGTFEIHDAGSTNTKTSEFLGAKRIKGEFNIMRDY